MIHNVLYHFLLLNESSIVAGSGASVATSRYVQKYTMKDVTPENFSEHRDTVLQSIRDQIRMFEIETQLLSFPKVMRGYNRKSMKTFSAIQSQMESLSTELQVARLSATG